MTDNALQSLTGVSEPVRDDIAALFQPDETIEKQLSGKGFVSTQAGETDDGAVRIVVTDHRVLFISGADVVELSHTDISDIELTSKLLRGSTVSITTWEGETYRFKPTDGDADAVVEYIEQLADAWQFVDALREELTTRAATIEKHVEREEFERAATALSDANETLAELTDRIERAGLRETFAPQITQGRQDIQRARLQGRLVRAQSLADAANASREQREYIEAFDQYDSARDHLFAANGLAAEYDLDADAVADELTRVETAMRELPTEPIERADRTAKQAVAARTPEERIEQFEQALDAYHTALAIGWGSPLELARNRERLKLCVELAATGIVAARCEILDSYEAVGDEFASTGELEPAKAQYEKALSELREALQIGHEFRTPDADSLEQKQITLESKIEDIEAWHSLTNGHES